MPVIPLVPSDSPTLISFLLRLSAHHLALAAASVSQLLKLELFLSYLSVHVPVLIPFVVTSRPTTVSRPSNPLNPSPLAPHIRLCWPLCTFINYIYLLTYLLIVSEACCNSTCIGLSSRVVSVSDCGVRGPRLESHRGWLFIATAAALYSLGHGLCTFTAVPRSTQPSNLRGTVQWASAYSLSNNNNGDGECGW